MSKDVLIIIFIPRSELLEIKVLIYATYAYLLHGKS